MNKAQFGELVNEAVRVLGRNDAALALRVAMVGEKVDPECGPSDDGRGYSRRDLRRSYVMSLANAAMLRGIVDRWQTPAERADIEWHKRAEIRDNAKE